MRKQARLLNHVTDSSTQPNRIPLRCWPSFYENLARRRRSQCVNQLESSGFSRAAAAQKNERLTAVHLEIQTRDQLRAFRKAVRNVAELDGKTVFGREIGAHRKMNVRWRAAG